MDLSIKYAQKDIFFKNNLEQFYFLFLISNWFI